jgi:hypothetical protein
VREQRVVLEHHAHVAVLGIEPRDVARAEHDAPGVGREQAGHDVQRGGLAAPAGAQEREKLALTHVDVDGPHAERGAVALHHALQLEDRLRHGLPRARPDGRLAS